MVGEGMFYFLILLSIGGALAFVFAAIFNRDLDEIEPDESEDAMGVM